MWQLIKLTMEWVSQFSMNFPVLPNRTDERKLNVPERTGHPVVLIVSCWSKGLVLHRYGFIIVLSGASTCSRFYWEIEYQGTGFFFPPCRYPGVFSTLELFSSSSTPDWMFKYYLLGLFRITSITWIDTWFICTAVLTNRIATPLLLPVWDTRISKGWLCWVQSTLLSKYFRWFKPL